MNAEVDEQDINNEEAKMEDQVIEKIDEELTCPLEPDKPWEESVCGVIEQRVMEQIMQRLKAKQPLEEVPAPADEGPELSEEPESSDELIEATEEDPAAAENSWIKIYNGI